MFVYCNCGTFGPNDYCCIIKRTQSNKLYICWVDSRKFF